MQESRLVSRSFNRRLPEEEVELPRSGYEEHSAHKEHFCVKLGESFLNEDPALGVVCLILADDEGPPNIGYQTKI